MYPTNSECINKFPEEINIPEGQTYDEYCNIEFRGFHANPIQSEKQIVRLHCSDRTLTYPPISNDEDDFDLPF